MKFLLGIVLGWFCSKFVRSQQRNSVPRITAPTEAAAVEQNPAPKITPVAPPVDEGVTVETRLAPPSHFLTKIESFSLCYKQDIKIYETREFEAGDHKWTLIIYPYGDPPPSFTNPGNGHVSVYLAIAETSSLPIDWEINVIFTIFVYNQVLDKYVCFRLNGGGRRFNETKCVWGFPKLISKKSLKASGYLVDDTFVVGAEVFVLKRPRNIERVTVVEKRLEKINVWEIREFSKLGQDIWSSKVFVVGHVKWKIELYPNGAPGYEGFLSVHLVCVSAESYLAHQRVKAKYWMQLEGYGFFITRTISLWFTSSARTCGYSRLINLGRLHDPKNGFLVDDTCTLEVGICVQAVVV